MAQARRAREDLYEIWPEHWDAVRLLMACDTQWIGLAVFGGGVYWQGLDFMRAADVAQRWLAITPNPPLFEQLATLVNEAKPLRNEHLKTRD